MAEKYYITTPIYYPSGNWHIGHCYTTVVSDALSRYHKMLGKDVFFLTGTDEHGQKIEKKAKEAGKEPKEFVDELVLGLKEIWKKLDVDYDKFIRTTDDYHIKGVQKIFSQLYEKGEIYKSSYEGWYCTPCESYWTESQLVDGKCPDCGREVTKEKEESYFFRLSKYSQRLIDYYESHPEFIQPKSRANEMINNFLKPGLTDLCVSRTSFKWGVPVPFDDNHIAYVWIDALSNYITALGYGSDNEELMQKYWPCNLHLMAKEIVRFHTIVWPAILMALDLPLPKQIFGHGWLLIGGDKLSKSKTDKVSTELVEPDKLIERYGSDTLRYFLLREIPFGNDGVYTNESFLNRINADLSNTLGNLVNRTTAMINQYFGGILPSGEFREEIDDSLISLCLSLKGEVDKAMESLNAPEALTQIFKVLSRANKYIDETMPWAMAKDETKRDRLGTVLYNLAETLRICSIMLMPYLTKAPKKILGYLSITEDIKSFDSASEFGLLKAGSRIEKSTPLFPRFDVKKELEDVAKFVIEEKKKKEEGKKKVENLEDIITIEEFFKTKLKLAKVIACEKVEKADKLLKLTVKVGDETRTIVSGIAKSYTPEEMVGKTVVIVANLKSAKLRGIESQGMILAAEDESGTLSLLTTDKDMPSGISVG